MIERLSRVQLPAVPWIALGAVAALVAGLFLWMARLSVTELTGPSAAGNHYNLLVAGFRSGHLGLAKEAPPELGRLADPYDPFTNRDLRMGHGLHDMTYYQGRLYLYFGVTPALVLFWPWVALTGHYLFQRYAVAIFCAVGFLASAGVLGALWRRYFPEVRLTVIAAGVLVLGLATGVPIMLQRAEFWEVAVSCGYAMVMLALGGIWRALHDRARRGWWLAAASLAIGLAVGARPSLLFSAAILPVPVILAWRELPAAGQRRAPPWGLLAAAAAPLALCGLGLMLYNDLRFDSPFDFGQRFQLAGDRQDTVRHFSLDYLWFNFRVYFLEPVTWHGYFPFVGDIVAPALPPDHAPVEDPYGVLTNIPVLWLALAAPLAWRGRPAEARAALRGFAVAVALVFATSAGILCLFYGNCSRYEVEFLPALAVLAVFGILGVERALAGRPVARRCARTAWGALLTFSIAFNLLAAADHYAVQRCQLANQMTKLERVPEAVAQYEAALRIKPEYVEAHSSLGNALLLEGRTAESIEQCRAALQLDPEYGRAHNNLGNALLAAGRGAEAIEHYETALRLQPDDPKVQYNFGVALATLGRNPEAIQHYEAALWMDPENTSAHYNLGNALIAVGRVPEAIKHYQAVVGVQPANVDAHNNLGNAFLQQGRVAEAIEQFAAALQLRPGYAEARNNLGVALFQVGRIPEAAAQFEAALRRKPDYREARDNLERARAMLSAAQPPR
jgi:tetratricopeptide (TPR) repeat protein